MSDAVRGKDLYIVDRRQPAVFRFLERRFQGCSDVELVWDRRRRERRVGSQAARSDRRRSDRRGPPPDFLVSPGFIVVPGPERAAAL
jgi:hypothetical protein